jgi:hypothetical protein
MLKASGELRGRLLIKTECINYFMYEFTFMSTDLHKLSQIFEGKLTTFLSLKTS